MEHQPTAKRTKTESEDFTTYVHSVSPQKKTKKNYMPFYKLVLQTERNEYHDGYFYTTDRNSVSIKKQLDAACSKKSPVKLKNATKTLSSSNSDYDIKCNSYTGIIPLPDVSFPHRPPPTPQKLKIKDIKKSSTMHEKVTVDAKVTKFLPEQKLTSTNGRPLILYPLHVSDETGSLQLAMWNEKPQLKLYDSYQFTNVCVKQFNDIKSLSFLTESSYIKIDELEDVTDEIPDEPSTQQLTEEIIGISVVICYKCVTCTTVLPVMSAKKLITCSLCKMKQRVSDLKKTIQTKIQLSNTQIKYSATTKAITDYLLQNEKNLNEMDHDDIEEFFLLEKKPLNFTIINHNIIDKIVDIDDLSSTSNFII